MTERFIIPGRLPSLNDLIDANRNNLYKGSKLKKEADEKVKLAIRQWRVKPFIGSVRLVVTFYERDRRRDPDNIFSGLKFILDAMVRTGIIEEDGQNVLKPPKPIEYSYAVDKENPRIEVEIISHIDMEDKGNGKNRKKKLR